MTSIPKHTESKQNVSPAFKSSMQPLADNERQFLHMVLKDLINDMSHNRIKPENGNPVFSTTEDYLLVLPVELFDLLKEINAKLKP